MAPYAQEWVVIVTGYTDLSNRNSLYVNVGGIFPSKKEAINYARSLRNGATYRDRKVRLGLKVFVRPNYLDRN